MIRSSQFTKGLLALGVAAACLGAQAAAQRPANQHRLTHGLHKIAPELGRMVPEGADDQAGGGQEHTRYIERAHQDFPEQRHPSTKQSRCRHTHPAAALHGRHAVDAVTRYKSQQHHAGPEPHRSHTACHTPPRLRSTKRSTPATMPVNARPKNADITSADQICVVCP